MYILLVEDEVEISQFIKRKLSKHHVIDIASCGDECFCLASINDYDIIILDIGLPDISGIDICKQLRKEKISCPILFLSGYSKSDIKVIGLNAGADDYLTKPFSFSELQARINALLRRKNNQFRNILSVGDLNVDPIARETFYKNTKIPLRNREFNLLEFLLRNKNMVLTREKIMSHVWGDCDSYNHNTLDVHLTRIRKKINQENNENKNGIIQNIRGVGYMIREKKR